MSEGRICRCGAAIPSLMKLCYDCRMRARKRKARAKLTEREKQVVVLVAQGKSNKEIASALRISEGTVKIYLSRSIFPKTGATNRLGVAVWWLKQQAEKSPEAA